MPPASPSPPDRALVLPEARPARKCDASHSGEGARGSAPGGARGSAGRDSSAGSEPLLCAGTHADWSASSPSSSRSGPGRRGSTRRPGSGTVHTDRSWAPARSDGSRPAGLAVAITAAILKRDCPRSIGCDDPEGVPGGKRSGAPILFCRPPLLRRRRHPITSIPGAPFAPARSLRERPSAPGTPGIHRG
jgi:hypothetical protein